MTTLQLHILRNILYVGSAGDVLVFAGTALVLATAAAYTGLVHGVSAGRLKQGRARHSADNGRMEDVWLLHVVPGVSVPYFLRPRSGAVLEKPPWCDESLAACMRWWSQESVLLPSQHCRLICIQPLFKLKAWTDRGRGDESCA